MPVRVRVDGERYVVIFEATGPLSLREIAESVPGMVSDAAYRPGMPQLVDLRGVTEAHASADELRELVGFFDGLTPRLEGRVAIVATRPVVFGISRMYEALGSRLAVELRVFADMGEACVWLGVAPG
jgi:hypothetical protein